MTKLLFRFASVLIVVAAVSAVVLLAGDVKAGVVPSQWAALISALPLLAIGVSFVIVQPAIRPRTPDLLKNLLLAATFLLWGAVQLMPRNFLSKSLGDAVIALYVIDLAWTILASPKPRAPHEM